MEMGRIYRERVDHKMMEIYDLRPFIRFRDILTGRFIRRPPRIGVIGISGGITWGGKEPLEVEAKVSVWIDIEELLEEFKTGKEIKEYFEEEGELEGKLDHLNYVAVRDNFNIWIAETLEFRGRELRQEIDVEEVHIRYRRQKAGVWMKWEDLKVPL